MLSTYCRYIYIPSLICFCFCFFLAMLLASVPFNLWCTVPAWDKSNHNLNGTDIYACAYGTYSAATETLLSACIYAGYHALSSGFREPQHYTCMKLQLSWSSPADEAKVRGDTVSRVSWLLAGLRSTKSRSDWGESIDRAIASYVGRTQSFDEVVGLNLTRWHWHDGAFTFSMNKSCSFVLRHYIPVIICSGSFWARYIYV